ncbi:MAG TPA: TetR family transcriptional regulator [Candidatus Acidoferrales bacterium]|nr:TetR family transcriptional regulator [Candidatus Acidoferrales bacterium]
MATISQHRGTRGQPEQSRNAILQAALEEFGANGLDGARMDAIARNAAVNKALVYYYFQDKQALYAAVLEDFLASRSAALSEVLQSDLPPGEKLLMLARRQFDFMAQHSVYPRLMLEAFSAERLPGRTLRHMVEHYIRPVSAEMEELVARGVRSGELVEVHGMHVGQMFAANTVFYFASAPIAEVITGRDPLAPAAIRDQRLNVLRLFASTFFADRERGLCIARKVFDAPEWRACAAPLKRGNK